MAEEKPKLHPISFCLYYLVLFFAYWFGASRFDQDGDGDFDAEDVEAYLADKGFIHNNFKKAPRSSKGRNSKRGSKQGNEPVKDSGGGIFSDKNGDGQVGIDDVMAARVSGQAEEDTIMHNLLVKQQLPWFIIFECSVCFFLWLVMSIKASTTDFLELKAGVDSFAEGMTDLRLSTDWGHTRAAGAFICEDNRFQAWRWWTYQWTHVGAMHVLMNVFLNVMLGVPLEGLHGHIRMVLMFNVGVFGGACCYFVNDAHTVVVGCSGGCYSLIGMHFADLIMNWNQKKFRWPTVVFLTLLVSVDIFSYTMSLSAENTSHSAHVGGFIAGTIIGILIGKNLKVKLWEQVLRCMLFFIGFGLVAFCIVWLVMNEAPRNIWEAAEGVDGYCWVRQIYNSTMDLDAWLCVRCGTDSCVDYWTPMKASPVSKTVCNALSYLANPVK